MKRIVLFLSLSLFLLSFQNNAIAGKGDLHYKVKVKIKGVSDTMLYLANYLGNQTYLVDSTMVNKKGVAVFERDTVLDCGIYMVALGRTKLFEFVVSEQEFTLETDAKDYMANMKVKGSKENEIFFEFQQYAYSLGVEENKYRQLLEMWGKDPARADTVAKINAYLKTIPKQMYDFREKFVKKYPNAILTQIFNAMREPKVPDPPKDENGNIIDSNWQYFWYKDHYWDNVNFTSGCVLRSPVYQGRLDRYMEKLTVQQPDSILASAITIIDKTLVNKEMFRFTLVRIMSKYEKSKFICMDAVPVQLALKYYTYDRCFWLDSAEIYRTRANAESYLPVLCNRYAPQVGMYDSILQKKIDYIVETDSNEQRRGERLGKLLRDEKSHIKNLYDIKAPYTVLVFWDPDCGHCKKEMPIINGFYDKVKTYGVEVYSACVEQDTKAWLKYISENNHKWISVTDSWNISGFRKSYNINSTPQIFLLDKDKKIIAKRLGAEQLKEILFNELKIEYTPPPKKEGDDKDDHSGHGH